MTEFNGSTEQLDKSMERVLSETLPEALNQLAQRHESFGQVVQYLEDNYIASQRSGKDKLAIENEAKRFVTKGLISVLKDIEVASLNVDQLLQMQSLAIDSITDDVSLIKSRLHGMKSQQLLSSLEEMKAASPAPPAPTSSSAVSGTASKKRVSVRKVAVDYAVKQVNTNHNTHSNNKTNASEVGDGLSEMDASVANDSSVEASTVQQQQREFTRRKIPIAERLASLDSVGKEKRK